MVESKYREERPGRAAGVAIITFGIVCCVLAIAVVLGVAIAATM
jgi:hypothetical protein